MQVMRMISFDRTGEFASVFRPVLCFSNHVDKSEPVGALSRQLFLQAARTPLWLHIEYTGSDEIMALTMSPVMQKTEASR